MRFVSVFGTAALLLFCSCEKHPVGEWPEVQKEHADPADETKPAANEGEKEESTAPEQKPTPADFFPEKSPSKSP